MIHQFEPELRAIHLGSVHKTWAPNGTQSEFLPFRTAGTIDAGYVLILCVPDEPGSSYGLDQRFGRQFALFEYPQISVSSFQFLCDGNSA